MKWLLFICVFFLPVAVFAQDEEVDPYAECGEILSSTLANEFVSKTQDKTFGSIGVPLRLVLVGEACSVDQVVGYMTKAGWELERGGIKNYDMPRDSYLYDFDSVALFCLSERGLLRLFNRCRGEARFFWIGETITWVSLSEKIWFDW